VAHARDDHDVACVDGSFNGELGAALESGVLDLVVELGLPLRSAKAVDVQTTSSVRQARTASWSLRLKPSM
jgi:hypothetical protein